MCNWSWIWRKTFACIVFQHWQWLSGPHLQLCNVLFPFYTPFYFIIFFYPFKRLRTLRLCKGFLFLPYLALSFCFPPLLAVRSAGFLFSSTVSQVLDLFSLLIIKVTIFLAFFTTHHLSPSFRCDLHCCTIRLILWLLSLNWMAFNTSCTSLLPNVLHWHAMPYNWPPSGCSRLDFWPLNPGNTPPCTIINQRLHMAYC